jgi:hypothetical protein
MDQGRELFREDVPALAAGIGEDISGEIGNV